MSNLLQFGLLIHIIGLATLAGATLAGFVTSRKFLVEYTMGKDGTALLQVTTMLSRIGGAGLGLLILSGLTMMAATHGIYGQQLWFKLKLVFILLVIAANIYAGNALQRRLLASLSVNRPEQQKNEQITKLANRINYLRIFLLVFMSIIFILSVFKFN